MKDFQTLQGFLANEEPEDLDPTFNYQATLRILGRDEGRLDFEGIQENLGLEPTSARRRGEKIGPRSPPAKQDMWMFQVPVKKDLELHKHIDALWAKLKPHIAYLLGLKKQANVDVFLGYLSNIDHAGVTIPHQSLEMFRSLELDIGLSIVVVADHS